MNTTLTPEEVDPDLESLCFQFWIGKYINKIVEILTLLSLKIQILQISLKESGSNLLIIVYNMIFLMLYIQVIDEKYKKLENQK